MTSPGEYSRARIVRMDPVMPDQAVLARAGQIIREGGLVAFPTETVYGLGANALDESAVSKIYQVKRRAAGDPLIVHLVSAEHLDQFVRDVPALVHILTAQFWPGPLTVVLPKRDLIPDVVTAGLPTVAVRVPRHPIAVGLLAAAGVPIAAPSANLFMRTSATLASHVAEDLGDGVDLILDGGPADAGIESTVIAVEGVSIRLLRPGAIPIEEVMRVLLEHRLDAHLITAETTTGQQPSKTPLTSTAEGSTSNRESTSAEAAEAMQVAQVSPGMLEKHYSPRARLLLFHGETHAARNAMRAAVQQELESEHTVGLLLLQEDVKHFGGVADRVIVENLGPSTDLQAVARRLFAAMRRLDARGVDVILARALQAQGIGRAIVDRLTRAAAGRVIRV